MKSYTVRNEQGRSFEVDEDKISAAEADGYLPVVQNGTEEHRVSFGDIPLALKDGYQPKVTSDVGPLESGVMGVAKGASFGFAPAIAGALETAGSTVGVRGLGGKFSDIRLESDEEDKQSIGDIYRGARDQKYKDYDESQEANPGVFTTGEIGGVIAQSAAIPGLNAAKGAKLATVVGKGALQGGIYGLGDSRADLTKGEFGDAAIDTAKGAVLGGAGAGAIHGAVKGAGYVGEKIANTPMWQKVEAYISTLPEKMQAKAREKAVEALNPILSQQERLEAGIGVDKVGQELLDSDILKNKYGLPTNTRGIYENLQRKSDEVGNVISKQLRDAQYVVPELTISSSEIADSIRKKAVEPNIKTPFWKGAHAVGKEADVIEGWDKNFSLPELNQYKSELGKRIKTWGSDNLSDKKVYEDMYAAVNDLIETEFKKMSGAGALAQKHGVQYGDDLLNSIINSEHPPSVLIDIYEQPLKDFKTAKGQYGALETAEKIAKKASAREAKNNDWGLTTWLSALSGVGVGAVGGPVAGVATGLAAAGARQMGRAYGNQSMALILNKLSKTPNLAKYAPVLQQYADKGASSLAAAVYVVAKNDPEFRRFLNDNPPEASQSEKLQSGNEEPGIEGEGVFDAMKPYKQKAAKNFADSGHENVGWALENLTPDSPADLLAMMPKGTTIRNMGDLIKFPGAFRKAEKVEQAANEGSMLDKIRARLDDTEHASTYKWIAQVEKHGADEPYVGRDFTNSAALKVPTARSPIQPIPVPVEKIGDLKGVLGKGVLKGESDPFGWMDTKYGVTKDLLAREKDKPLKIFTRSDLVAHDDYIQNMNPTKHEVNMVMSFPDNGVGRLLEPGAPSIKRRIEAANKLQEQGFKVNFFYQKFTNKNLSDSFDQFQPDDFSTLRELQRMGLNKGIGVQSQVQSIDDEAVKRMKKILGEP